MGEPESNTRLDGSKLRNFCLQWLMDARCTLGVVLPAGNRSLQTRGF
jgi:hypothetical protein